MDIENNMQRYIGTKRIYAQPMTRQMYCDHQGWDLPEDEDGNDAGYLVEYVDSGKPNHPAHAGYISWSPKEVFEEAYQKADGGDFGMALAAVKLGHKVARKGWNGKDMFIFLVPGSTFKVNRPPLLGIYPEGTEINYHSHIDMRNALGEIVPWLASQTDMLATDWEVVID